MGGGRGGGSFGATEESAATQVQRAKQRDSHTEDQCRPALTSPLGLSAHPLWQVGAGSWGSGFGRSQGEDWGWLREHSLKGASVPQLAGRESRKKFAEEVRDHCFGVHEERGLPTEVRAPPKWAPETGVSHSYQLRPQRRAWNANAAAAATKNHVCKHRSLSTLPHGSLCSPPLSGPHDPGTTSPGEHMVSLRLLERHAGLGHRRLALCSSYNYCTPPSSWPE